MFLSSERLRFFPIAFLAPVLGFAGFSLALQKLEDFLHLDTYFSFIFTIITAGFLIFVLVIYSIKLFTFPAEVKKDFYHPIRLNFFPIIAKVFLILSIIFFGFHLSLLSEVLWYIGAILQIVFTFVVFRLWIHKDYFSIEHINPSFFIPIVGNIIVPIVGVNFVSPEVLWFYFSVGLMLWIVFTVVVFYRVVFHDPLPQKFLPTLFILMAPPAIGFISYVKLTQSFDSFAKVLYNFSLFLFLSFVFQFRHFSRLKFFLSSWAYSFPLAAFVVATYMISELSHVDFYLYLFVSSFAIFVVVMGYLGIQTWKSVSKKQLCIEE